MANKILIAFIGMPGSGKSEVANYTQKKGFPYIRFGDLTEEELKKKNLPITPENEKVIRESLRAEFGMDVYAQRTKPKIDQFFLLYDVVVVDGLYSWEEYLFLTKEFSTLFVVHVFAERAVRYDRLAKRAVRPFTKEQAEERDIAEIEKLNKGGPIAMADFLLENNSQNSEELHQKIDELFVRLGIKL